MSVPLRTLMWTILFALLASCERAASTSVVLAAESQGVCEVPDVPKFFEAALCSGNPRLFGNAVAEIDVGNRQDDEQVKRAMRRLWERDRGVGQNLPWQQLETPGYRAAMIDVVAQAVRNGQMNASLAEMQREAKQIADAERGFDGFVGIRLLGITDSVEELPYLRELAFADDPSARRSRAIEALGYICDARATEILQELLRTFPHEESTVRHARQALDQRGRLDDSWCNHKQ